MPRRSRLTSRRLASRLVNSSSAGWLTWCSRNSLRRPMEAVATPCATTSFRRWVAIGSGNGSRSTCSWSCGRRNAKGWHRDPWRPFGACRESLAVAQSNDVVARNAAAMTELATGAHQTGPADARAGACDLARGRGRSGRSAASHRGRARTATRRRVTASLAGSRRREGDAGYPPGCPTR
ncbi:MAG: hypothetical protein K0S14_2593 [Thermomicrobiales bacterium]|nr:hypothetical protein [Thermomicrobiales bacterium]